MSIDSDLIRGHIDTIILKILKEGDRYGYEICKEVEDKTGGAYELKQPTLYSCLKRLEDQKLISSYWKDSDIGGRRHYYKLTTKGKTTLDKNQEEWQKSRSIIDSLIYSEKVNYPTFENQNNESESIINENIISENEEKENQDTYVLLNKSDTLLLENNTSEKLDTSSLPKLETESNNKLYLNTRYQTASLTYENKENEEKQDKLSVYGENFINNMKLQEENKEIYIQPNHPPFIYGSNFIKNHVLDEINLENNNHNINEEVMDSIDENDNKIENLNNETDNSTNEKYAVDKDNPIFDTKTAYDNFFDDDEDDDVEELNTPFIFLDNEDKDCDEKIDNEYIEDRLENEDNLDKNDYLKESVIQKNSVDANNFMGLHVFSKDDLYDKEETVENKIIEDTLYDKEEILMEAKKNLNNQERSIPKISSIYYFPTETSNSYNLSKIADEKNDKVINTSDKNVIEDGSNKDVIYSKEKLLEKIDIEDNYPTLSIVNDAEENNNSSLEQLNEDIKLEVDDGVQENLLDSQNNTNIEESIDNILNETLDISFEDKKQLETINNILFTEANENTKEDQIPNQILNKDDNDFNIDDYLNRGRSYFNSGTNVKIVHNLINKYEEEKPKQEQDGYDYSEEKSTLESFNNKAYESNESDFVYTEPDENKYEQIEEVDETGVKNVTFQNEDDKKFTDEIMLSFTDSQNSNIDDEYAYNNTSVEKKENTILSSTADDRLEEEKINELPKVIIEETKVEPPKQALNINTYIKEMGKIGIGVKPYNRKEDRPKESKDYVLINKLMLVRSGICSCIIIFLLSFMYIVLNNQNVFDNTFDGTYIYFLIGIIASLLIPGIYSIVYSINPFKKQTPKFAFRLSMLFGILFFIQSLVIIFSMNIMLGFVSFSQVDYNHIQWIVPSIISIWFILSPIIHYYLFTSKKFFV